MKIKVVSRYKDLEMQRIVEIGEELEVTKARGKQLIAARVGKEIPIEPTTEKTPKKRKKKEA